MTLFVRYQELEPVDRCRVNKQSGRKMA